jgi:hypothetical protein
LSPLYVKKSLPIFFFLAIGRLQLNLLVLIKGIKKINDQRLNDIYLSNNHNTQIIIYKIKLLNEE